MDPSTHGNGSTESEHAHTTESEHAHNPTKRELSVGDLADTETRNKIEDGKDASYVSSSSSDTSSDGDDFFQIEPSPLRVATVGPNEVKKGNHAESTSSDPVRSIKNNGSSSPYSPSGVSETDSSGMDNSKQSPPVQVMGKSDVPDPKRIPSSVFARTKSNTPMEWSVASNESLFSIHMGKSGDFAGYGNQFECYSPMPPTYSPSRGQNAVVTNDLHQPSSPLPPLSPPPQQKQEQQQRQYEYQQTSAVEAANADAMKDFIRATASLHPEKTPLEGIPHSESKGRLSDSSVNSYQSFAFPILAGDARNISLKTGSMQEPTHQEQPQQSALQTEAPKAPEPAPAERQGKWFSCFSCCPKCC